MKETLKITIEPFQNGQRVDKIFSEALGKKISRVQLQTYGLFSLQGKSCPGKTRAKTGETWEVEWEIPDNFLHWIEPWDFPLTILQETPQWVVLDKPYGVSVHPSLSEKTNQTILNALLFKYGTKGLPEQYDEVEGVKIPKMGLVHRLDKTTSGILLVAKEMNTLNFFQEHWKDTKKIYYAVTSGRPPRKGFIEGAIIRHPQHKTKMMVSLSEKAKDAYTSFEVVEQTPKYSLLKIQIHSGRTHQIRVHLSSIGFPILGDDLYGGLPFKRVMLHAQSLEFPDPQNPKEKITVESSLPLEFSTFQES